jgi:hypothetical protein
MSTNYIQVIVRQRIPAACLVSIEKWLLARIFETEERGDFLVFHNCWEEGMLRTDDDSSDDKLREALAASRELCPELCAEVEFLTKKNEFRESAIDYKRIFQSIVRRHPDVLHHVSIEELDCNTNRGLEGETLTIITAQSIMSIDSLGERNQRRWNPHDSSLRRDDIADVSRMKR